MIRYCLLAGLGGMLIFVADLLPAPALVQAITTFVGVVILAYGISYAFTTRLLKNKDRR